jgi:hypothetical protein
MAAYHFLVGVRVEDADGAAPVAHAAGARRRTALRVHDADGLAVHHLEVQHVDRARRRAPAGS